MDNIIDRPRTPDFYRDLGISKNASAATIRKAFNGLALATHPDKNCSNNTGSSKDDASFRKVREAYEYLSDPKKRAKYDKKHLYIQAAWERYHRQQTKRSEREEQRIDELVRLCQLEEQQMLSRENASKACEQDGRVSKRKIHLQKDAAAETRSKEVSKRRRAEQEEARERLMSIHVAIMNYYT
ncbi:DnaJ domain-containing protein [Xylaria curta]|nr:DnaJ domain-containing protein [Xylaria curta]